MSSVIAEHPTTIPVPDINDVHANNSETNGDPFKFSHGLTGVDQPANYFFVNILVTTIFAVVFLVLCFRIIGIIQRDRRRIFIISSPQNQDFWASNRFSCWAWLKRYIIYSPIWNSRHNREFRISSVVNMGTLPTRLQLTIILIYAASNIAYCLAIPKQLQEQRIAEFRGRTGALAVFNLIPTILFALRNNPFIWIFHISYDTFNLLHRWTARIVFVETLAHIVAFMYNTYQVEYDRMNGWNSINWVLGQSLSYRWGLVGLVAFTFLVLHSIGPLRHAFYETFLSLHRLSIIIAVSGVYFHLAKHSLPQLPWGYLSISFLVAELGLRVARIVYRNSSWEQRIWTKVTVEALPGEASRVTFHLPQHWNANPGSYVHVYLPRIALWSSHPFSVAWSNDTNPPKFVSIEKRARLSIEDLEVKHAPSTISCIVRARTGTTRTLYDRAKNSPAGNLRLWGAIEGPYGGYHSLDSYGTVVLFAGGVGITHQLTHIRHLLVGYNAHTMVVRKILLVWSIRSTEMLEWINPWLDEITSMPNCQNIVRFRIHVSKPVSGEALPMGLDVRAGRCDPQDIVDQEVINQIGAMAITVCGPGAYSDAVRAAVRKRMGLRSIDFIEEAFSY